ncbi:TrbG/VirB9 family P-type conjugative transfer protein [Altererythrobacter sp. KTW20L]|uniref:TrbG/VirB9 family P-type conjugative transfer protein n=1 Tax=Altererythrobacter sp. KTW20L TaxID=2942210 RepID=UPI0020C0BC4E|nr:TrbG/VirB9 family P-type conjugative transfer protein [Altererythrobacter sp. KTW20L]MCL6250365.1 TrbG/VirB9 family P-type conjugative transfer protein [Altererythrobacter sp. KTW20L]
MTRAILIAALLASASLASPAIAQGDPRLVVREYSDSEVVRVAGQVNVQATIRFADGEQIQNVAIGDSQKWQVTPSRSANLLFVKPLSERATTNMTVVTDRRVYLFDLVASPAHRNPLYVLSFTYADEPVEEEEDVQLAEDGSRIERANPLEMAAATDDFAIIDPASLNFAWASEGAPALLPETVYDNGSATFLAWPVGEAMPAILIKDEQGMEGPVNFAVRGDVIVIDAVPAEIILRSGDNTARLVNQRPAALAGA